MKTTASNTIGSLPNCIIIGAMKCATTSLHYYLNLHPQISMSRQKEVNFFIDSFNWHKGIEWYQDHFSGATQIRGESSTGYTAHPLLNGVPQKMHSVVPEAKLIYILRDPVERIISHYMHRWAEGLEQDSIEQVVMANDGRNPYVYRSRYFMQIEQYLPYYPPSRLLIMTTDDLRYKRRDALRCIYRYLKVDESYRSPRFHFSWHRSKYKRRLFQNRNPIVERVITSIIGRAPFEVRGVIERLLWLPFSKPIPKPVMEETFRRRLIDLLKPDMNSLRRFSGRSFNEWCV